MRTTNPLGSDIGNGSKEPQPESPPPTRDRHSGDTSPAPPEGSPPPPNDRASARRIDHEQPPAGRSGTRQTTWFERITGFREEGYASTRKRLAVEDSELVSLVNGSRHGIGEFEIVTLAELRGRAGQAKAPPRPTSVRCAVGDVRRMHADPGNRDALFQVASQFNMLEMLSPQVTPEHGVTRYMLDQTQGPACAMAAGAATIWRNYFAPVGGATGQTASRQLDALQPMGRELSQRLGRTVQDLWTMQNGYVLCTLQGLSAIGRLLRESSAEDIDNLRGCLAIGLQRGAEVTDLPQGQRHRVSQAFCSGLPVGYQGLPDEVCEPFARLILEASYEATLWAACELAANGGSSRVLLTRVGGGVFCNDDRWIDDAIKRAIGLVRHAGLDVQLVSYGAVHPSFEQLERLWTGPDTAVAP